MIKDTYNKCILVCAGELDKERKSIPDVENSLVIAVDGGLGYCNVLGIKPDIIIGDFDSASPEDKLAMTELSNVTVKKLPCEKDDTDTIAAIREGLERGFKEFVLYAAHGGRIDHYFANIQALLFIRHHGAVGRIIANDFEIFIIENETVELEARDKGTVSLFAMGENAEDVTIKGLYYEVESTSIRNDYPIGISNEFCGKDVSITVGKGALVCMLGR